jgi:hypothetical protein
MNMNTPNRLPSSPQKYPFKTPDDYFDGLTNRIMQSVDEAPKTLSWFRQYRYAIVATAAILVFGFGLWWNLSSQPPLSPEQDDIEYYLTYQHYLNTYDLLNLMEEEMVFQEPASSFELEVIEEYLLLTPSVDYYLESKNTFE